MLTNCELTINRKMFFFNGVYRDTSHLLVGNAMQLKAQLQPWASCGCTCNLGCGCITLYCGCYRDQTFRLSSSIFLEIFSMSFVTEVAVLQVRKMISSWQLDVLIWEENRLQFRGFTAGTKVLYNYRKNSRLSINDAHGLKNQQREVVWKCFRKIICLRSSVAIFE